MPGRWLWVVLRALDEHPHFWVCTECGHEGLEVSESHGSFQGARHTLTTYICPDCFSRGYTA